MSATISSRLDFFHSAEFVAAAALRKPSVPSEVVAATRMIGVFERIARQMKKSPSHVLRVAHGERPSKQIIDAIVKEVRRVLTEADAA
jgi:hypothetical protein